MAEADMPVSYGELLQNRYGSGVGNGWSSLGAALSGNGVRREQAALYGAMMGQRMQAQNATIADKLAAGRNQTAQAVLHEAESAARNTYLNDYSDAMAKRDYVRATALAHLAGFNPEQEALANVNYGRLGAQQQAQAAADAGDMGAANQQLAIVHGQPLQITHVADNVAFNPYAPSAGQPFTPTSIGEAMTTEKNAQAAAANALAAKRGMGGGMPGGLPPGVFQDDTGTHGKLPDGTIVNFDNTMPKDAVNAALSGMLVDHPILKPQSLPAAELKSLFPDEGKRMQFLAETANKADSNKNYLNGPYAAQKYAQAHQFDDVESTLGAPPPEPSMLGRVLGAFSGSSPAPQAAPQQAPAQAAASPYKEGQKLRGPDGKTYVVQNGQPVPL